MLAGHAVNMPGLPIAACTLPGKSNIAVARPADPTSSHDVLAETWLSTCRGICHKGKDCDYLHQLPTEYHEQLLTSDHTVDIFGRDKLAGSNMGTKGVGTYDRESKTLYVNYGGAGHLGAPVIRQLLQVIGTCRTLCRSLALEFSQMPAESSQVRLHMFVQEANICNRMQDNFDEWGPIERIYNVASKTIAFVQYYWRASAEFAKEAKQVTSPLVIVF